MRLTDLPQTYRNINRLREIVAILSKYGLADWLSQFKLDIAKRLLKTSSGDILTRYSREARIRLALTELGPTFIKLGQLLSTRPDVVGVALANELEKLQTDVPADEPESVRQRIEAELGQPVDEIFDEFDDKPVASASIGQVHQARLKNGRRVAVKVRHASIEQTVEDDLGVLTWLAQLAERVPALKNYRPVLLAAEFQRTLRRELDFGREERNLQQFAKDFSRSDKLKVPKPFPDLCTSRVLTMEWLKGKKLNELDCTKVDCEGIARDGTEIYLKMIFIHGFYHADPHPGNILVLPGNIIGLLDFGMVGRIDEDLHEQIIDLLLAIVNNDAKMLTSIITRIGAAPEDLNEAALRRDLTDFVAYYGSRSLDEFDLSLALNEMTEIIRRFRIYLPAQVGLLIKVLITLEGTSKLLHPSFSLAEVLQSFQQTLLRHRLSPKRHLKRLRRLYGELGRFFEMLPHYLLDIAEKLDTGRLDVHLQHRGMEPSVNRLVLGMMTSALFLGSSLMLSLKVPPVLFQTPTWLGLHNVSIVGTVGIVVSLLLGARLLRAIGKSGHLDRRGR